MSSIILGDNLHVLPVLPEASVRLAYIDPPFNTGMTQRRTRITAVADPDGDRIGFGDARYRTTAHEGPAYGDDVGDLVAYLLPRIERAIRCLTPDGSLMVHLDWREVHYVKVALDGLLGRRSFMNEIIWAYDFGGRSKSRWPTKHDTILWYALDPRSYVFDYDAIDRVPYMAPELVGPEKAKRGKTPTDVWWHTIVPTNGREKTGYPTQKPLGILNRIIRVHTEPGDTVLDFFAGSGTTGDAAASHGRKFVLVDEHREAVDLMSRRLAEYAPTLLELDLHTRSLEPLSSVDSPPRRADALQPDVART